MTKTVHGVVRGNSIEVVEDLGVAEGQAVEVQVTVLDPPSNWGAGLQRAAGAMADDWTEEDDRILEEIYRERKQDTRREISK